MTEEGVKVYCSIIRIGGVSGKRIYIRRIKYNVWKVDYRRTGEGLQKKILVDIMFANTIDTLNIQDDKLLDTAMAILSDKVLAGYESNETIRYDTKEKGYFLILEPYTSLKIIMPSDKKIAFIIFKDGKVVNVGTELLSEAINKWVDNWKKVREKV